jgi:RHS repeat-associated protein
VYDDAGRLIGEYSGSGELISEHVWLDDTPVAVLKPATSPQGGQAIAASGSAPALRAYFVHPDHLDTPRVIVNAANQTVWRWDSTPYGDTEADENPNGLGEFSYSLRLPGQQYDGESGQHYNYFRDYEAATGRYVQSDPIGLEGGLATYTYVESSPLDGVDPLGLWRFRDIKSCADLGRIVRSRAHGRFTPSGSCSYCNSAAATQRDHYWPVKMCWDAYRSGRISLSKCIYLLNKNNLAGACGPCNRSKSGNPPTVTLPGFPTTSPF